MGWNKQRQIREQEKQIALVEGRVDAARERLSAVDELEDVKRQLQDAKLDLTRIQEDHARENREIEHKVGLHRIQTEQETKAAVTQAKLEVREEALTAKEERFKEEMEFMEKRMTDEIHAQRALLDNILTRLPSFSHQRVEHIGTDPNPAQRLEITDGQAG